MATSDRDATIRMMRILGMPLGLTVVDDAAFDAQRILLARARVVLRSLLDRPTPTAREQAEILLADMEAADNALIPRPPSDPALSRDG